MKIIFAGLTYDVYFFHFHQQQQLKQQQHQQQQLANRKCSFLCVNSILGFLFLLPLRLIIVQRNVFIVFARRKEQQI